MRKFRFSPLLIGLSLLLPSGGFCEIIASVTEITTRSVFAQFLLSAFFQNQLVEYTQLMDQKLGDVGNESMTIPLGQLGILQPIVISPGDQYPTSGIWMHRYELNRGDQIRTYNVYFFAQPDRPPKRAEMIMGHSRANLKQVGDALPDVLRAAITRNPKAELDNTEHPPTVADANVVEGPVETPDNQGNRQKTWMEKWMVRVQGQDTPVLVRFTVTAHGGLTTYEVLNEKDTADFLYANP